MNLTEREEQLVDQISCNLVNRGFVLNEDFEYAKAELTLMMKHAKKLVYDEISDLLLNHSLQFKEITDEVNP